MHLSLNHVMIYPTVFSLSSGILTVSVKQPQLEVLRRDFHTHMLDSEQSTSQYTNPYQCAPILSDKRDSSSQRIRILELNGDAGDVESPLVASLQVQSLHTEDAIHQYEALSYVWGKPTIDRNRTCSILIQIGQANTFRLEITPNLSSALTELRKDHRTRRLWVDAICIDQQSDDEKNNQVPLMATIYSGAKHVCVWLGKSQVDTYRAVRQIKRILNPRLLDTIVENDSEVADWVSLMSFMDSEWFSRWWIIQEIALARTATLYCGEYKVD